MPIWIQVILAWIILGAFLNLIMFKLYYKKWVTTVVEETDYTYGYKHATTNISMYYAIYNEFPSAIWINRVQGSCLDSRQKLLESNNI